jgi:hypothetical protein
MFAFVVIMATALTLLAAQIASPFPTSRHRCTRGEVWRLVSGFTKKFSRGHFAALDRTFAHGANFRWYSTTAPGERITSDALNRRSLIDYFKRRHAQHERLQLTWLKVVTPGRRLPATSPEFQFRLTRSADDLSPTPYFGKGEAFCLYTPHTIAVWSMGAD